MKKILLFILTLTIASTTYASKLEDQRINGMLNALGDPNPTVQKMAFDRIAELDTSQISSMPASTGPNLIKAASSKDPDIAKFAQGLLDKVEPMGRKELKLLIKMLRSKNTKEKLLTIKAIGDMGNKARKAKFKIKKLTRNKNKEISQAANETLIKISVKK